MLFTIPCVVLLLGFLCPILGDDGDETCPDPSVAKFASSFYAAMVVSLDPDIVFNLELPGTEAAKLFYSVIHKDLSDRQLCNAGPVAKTVARAVASEERFFLYSYIKNKGIVVGLFLLERGILTCDNAILLAYAYFGIVLTFLSKLDETEFISYIAAISYGVVVFVEGQGFNLLESVSKLALIFYKEFNNAS